MTLTLKNGKQAPFSLRESAQYDFENGAKNKLTAWGQECKIRAEKNRLRKENSTKRV